MQIFLIILLILAMIGAVVMLVRGVVAFLQTTEADLKSGSVGPSQSGLRQNKMMMGRIGFQAIAVLIVVLIISLSRSG
jgi:NADH:ubiquinone oxidoreductase subunit 6 (subunit J)